MLHHTCSLPHPSGPCPPADDPEAILRWLYWRHLSTGRIEKRREHADPFWRRIEEKREERLRLAERLLADPAGEMQMRRLAAIFGLDLAGLSLAERAAAVAAACVPMRFHLSGALEELGELERAAEVLVTAY